MNLSRRAFLASLGFGAAAILADPDLLLWKPGAKSFFLPDAPKGWSLTTSGLLTKGDIFTIDGYYAVNPVTGREVGHLQYFVVTDDVTSPTINVTKVYPPIVPKPNETRAFARPLMGNVPHWPIQPSWTNV